MNTEADSSEPRPGRDGLTAQYIKCLTQKPTEYMERDSRGLYLLVKPNGAKLWRLRYAFEGRERLMSLGAYPEVSIGMARKRRDDARAQVANGNDPLAAKQAEVEARSDTFAAVAELYLAKKQASGLSAGSVRRETDRLRMFINPKLGKRPIGSLTADDFRRVLEAIPTPDGKRIETAQRTRAICGQVMRYAMALGLAPGDPVSALTGLLPTATVESFAALVEPKAVGRLMLDIERYQAGRDHASPVVSAALQMMPYVFVRPMELRTARWEDIDLEGAEPTWRIPAERMKMKVKHLVPLSRQVVAILKPLKEQTGAGVHVFPAPREDGRGITEAAVRMALRRMGYSGEVHTAHGFRTTASTMMNEAGKPPELIEMQLAHGDPDKVRAVYHRGYKLAERRELMQWWADYLDGLREQARERERQKVSGA